MKGLVYMSINDLQNINNIRQTHHYIQVNSSNTEKKMSQEQSLFDFSSSNNSGQSFLLFPGGNEYDDEQSAKDKSNFNLFM